ncbi:MAG: DNA-directed RNA polymerase subunit omega [Deinococcus sp.]|nr:DNA-directed RNA polymerase subunit omega [Deinococcus sp.]
MKEDFDTLLGSTGSKYLLATIIAKRAAQLRAGLPAAVPPRSNPVTTAMAEMSANQLVWGNDLVPQESLERAMIAAKAALQPAPAFANDEPDEIFPRQGLASAGRDESKRQS